MKLEYFKTPLSHIFIPQLINPEIYQKILFPELPEHSDGRIGRDLYPGETRWSELMASPGWTELSHAFINEKFMKEVIDLFADDIRKNDCLIDPDAVYLEPCIETPQQAKLNTLSDAHDPNALFIRFDLQSIGSTYQSYVHCDWPRRVCGGLLFMTSAADEELDGGEFALFSDLEFKNDRVCHKPQVEKIFPLQHNQGVIFLNSNRGFHGPMPIRKMRGMRKWVYFSISSRRNIWKARPTLHAVEAMSLSAWVISSGRRMVRRFTRA